MLGNVRGGTLYLGIDTRANNVQRWLDDEHDAIRSLHNECQDLLDATEVEIDGQHIPDLTVLRGVCEHEGKRIVGVG